jgi:mono/diheme cytochrome c family protein
MIIGIVYARIVATKKKRAARQPKASYKPKRASEALASPKTFERNRIRRRNKAVTAITLAVAILVGYDKGAAGPKEPGKAASQTADATPSKTISPRKLTDNVTAQMVEQGRSIFHGRGGCFRCHGKDGAGTFFGPALNDDRHIHLQTGSYQEILDLIRSGVPRPKQYLTGMPPSGGAPLADDELRAVAAYVFSIDRNH